MILCYVLDAEFKTNVFWGTSVPVNSFAYFTSETNFTDSDTGAVCAKRWPDLLCVFDMRACILLGRREKCIEDSIYEA